MIEKSIAIKAPKVVYQLMGAKKFQQFLYQTNAIEKFLNDQKIASMLKETFVKQYYFDKV